MSLQKKLDEREGGNECVVKRGRGRLGVAERLGWVGGSGIQEKLTKEIKKAVQQDVGRLEERRLGHDTSDLVRVDVGGRSSVLERVNRGTQQKVSLSPRNTTGREINKPRGSRNPAGQRVEGFEWKLLGRRHPTRRRRCDQSRACRRVGPRYPHRKRRCGRLRSKKQQSTMSVSV